MSTDPFHLLGPEFDPPPTFDEAVRSTVARFRETADRFAELAEGAREESFDEDEWQVVLATLEELAAAVERADEGFVAVQYDAHAWYRIMENLEQATLRMESAAGLIERVREREATDGPPAPGPASE